MADPFASYKAAQNPAYSYQIAGPSYKANGKALVSALQQQMETGRRINAPMSDGADGGVQGSDSSTRVAKIGDMQVSALPDGRYIVYKKPPGGNEQTPGDIYDANGNFLGGRYFDTTESAAGKFATQATKTLTKAFIAAGIGGAFGMGPFANGQVGFGIPGAEGAAGPAGYAGDPTAWGYGVPEGAAGAGGAVGVGGAGAAAAGGGAAGGGAGAAGGLGSSITNLIKAAAGAGGGTSGWASLISPAMSAFGSYLQYNAAGDASDAMVGAAQGGIAENRRQFDTMMGLLKPYIQAGTRGLSAYEALAGTKGTAAQQAAIAGLEASPEYGAYLSEGEEAILSNAAATGGLRGGDTQGALAQFRPKLLASLIDRKLGHYDRLTQFGQNSATNAGTQAIATGQSNANLMQQAGAAEAGGIVAGQRAINSALGGVGGFAAGRYF